jgi:uncharacterized RmlC-like cupin family protein
VDRPQVITRQALENPPAEQTTNIERGQAFAHDGVWAGFVVFPGGASTGWHHHGDYATYGYVTSGGMTVEFGPRAASWSKSAREISSTSPRTWSIASRSPPMEEQASSSESAESVPRSSTWRDQTRQHDPRPRASSTALAAPAMTQRSGPRPEPP